MRGANPSGPCEQAGRPSGEEFTERDFEGYKNAVRWAALVNRVTRSWAGRVAGRSPSTHRQRTGRASRQGREFYARTSLFVNVHEMPRVDTRPFFLGGDGTWAEGEILLEADDCIVVKSKEMIDLTPGGLWTKRHTQLAERYKVNSVGLDNSAFGDRQTAEFLFELPILRRVSLSLWSPIDLSALGRLRELKSLRISLSVWRSGDRFRPVDFSGLRKLQFADVMMCRAFESVLKCRTLKELAVRNECDGRLRDLDLTQLPALRDLELDHCPKLRSVRLHPKARVRALEQTVCGSFKIDWHRLGPHLRYLLLGGRLTFPLEDILNAPKLEELHMHRIRKLPALGFLRKLRDLRTVLIFTPPPGPNLSGEDKAIIREVNARDMRKPKKLADK